GCIAIPPRYFSVFRSRPCFVARGVADAKGVKSVRCWRAKPGIMSSSRVAASARRDLTRARNSEATRKWSRHSIDQRLRFTPQLHGAHDDTQPTSATTPMWRKTWGGNLQGNRVRSPPAPFPLSRSSRGSERISDRPRAGGGVGSSGPLSRVWERLRVGEECQSRTAKLR